MKEALKLALEALEDWDSPMALPAIYAIKEALAQDELCSSQEPVAWFIDVTTDGLSTQDYQVAAKEYWGNLSICFPLYNTPPKRPWVGLTDEDVFAVVKKLQTLYHRPPIAIFAQGIEATLKEKNT